MRVATLILAAGNSKRMGTIKQLLPYKNTTLLEWTIQKASKLETEEVICVLGQNSELITSKISSVNITYIVNQNSPKGLSSSIIRGIEHIQNKNYDGILIILGDQPKIPTFYLKNLLESFSDNPSKIISSNYGNKLGVPAIFPRKYYQELKNLKGDAGAKILLNNQRSISHTIESQFLIDIDTPEDYQKLIGK